MPADTGHAVVETAKRFLSTFKSPGLILVAVSGGSDSKGLLLALNAAITHGGFSAFSIAACTVDHGLRASSAGEARAVASLCANLGIPHRVRQWLGDKPTSGLQAAARQARYGLLADVADELDATCIVTGHTANDQIETIAMRASRSRPDALGLAGMASGVLVRRRVWVLRPFLGLPRMAIRDYLQSLGETWFDDPSNSNTGFERVRIREHLQHAPHAIDAQGHAAGEARRRSSDRVAALLREYARSFDGLAVRIDPALADNMGDLDCLRAILTLTAIVGGQPHLPTTETAQRLSVFLASGQDGRMTAGRVVFDRRRCALYLYREARGLPEIDVLAGESGVWDGRFIVTNSGAEMVHVCGGGPARGNAWPIVAGLPEQIVKRAVKSSLAASGPSATSCGIEARISLYDTFLPCFDRIIGDTVATIFCRDRYLAPPVHDVLTQTTGF